MTGPKIWIFSYGTLRQPEVQIGVFGRRLAGEPDVLCGYVTRLQRVTDPTVIAMSGAAEHPMLVATGRSADQVEGIALAVNDKDLTLVDRYEAASRYRRMEITLRSGREAFVYVYEG